MEEYCEKVSMSSHRNLKMNLLKRIYSKRVGIMLLLCVISMSSCVHQKGPLKTKEKVPLLKKEEKSVTYSQENKETESRNKQIEISKATIQEDKIDSLFEIAKKTNSQYILIEDPLLQKDKLLEIYSIAVKKKISPENIYFAYVSSSNPLQAIFFKNKNTFYMYCYNNHIQPISLSILVKSQLLKQKKHRTHPKVSIKETRRKTKVSLPKTITKTKPNTQRRKQINYCLIPRKFLKKEIKRHPNFGRRLPYAQKKSLLSKIRSILFKKDALAAGFKKIPLFEKDRIKIPKNLDSKENFDIEDFLFSYRKIVLYSKVGDFTLILAPISILKEFYIVEAYPKLTIRDNAKNKTLSLKGRLWGYLTSKNEILLRWRTSPSDYKRTGILGLEVLIPIPNTNKEDIIIKEKYFKGTIFCYSSGSLKKFLIQFKLYKPKILNSRELWRKVIIGW